MLPSNRNSGCGTRGVFFLLNNPLIVCVMAGPSPAASSAVMVTVITVPAEAGVLSIGYVASIIMCRALDNKFLRHNTRFAHRSRSCCCDAISRCLHGQYETHWPMFLSPARQPKKGRGPAGRRCHQCTVFPAAGFQPLVRHAGLTRFRAFTQPAFIVEKPPGRRRS